jgi:hypothetical protein
VFNRWAQFVTPLSVLISAALVLLLFQRPQIDELAAASLSNEQAQNWNTLAEVRQYPNPQDRKVAYEILRRLWPLHDEIQLLENADQVINQPIVVIDATQEARCQPFLLRQGGLQKTRLDVKVISTSS